MMPNGISNLARILRGGAARLDSIKKKLLHFSGQSLKAIHSQTRVLFGAEHYLGYAPNANISTKHNDLFLPQGWHFYAIDR